MSALFTPIKTICQFSLCGVTLTVSDYMLTILLWPIGVVCVLAALCRINNEMIQFSARYVYNTFYDIFYGYLKEKGKIYIPFLLYLMMFIFIMNLANLVPILHPCSSQFAFSASLAMLVFFISIIVGIFVHRMHFFNYFIPQDVPLALKPFMFILEVISFMIRPLSLALRLAVNMLAGHIMMHVIASFGHSMSSKLIGIPILGILGIFELGVAGLQAYVFAVLSCIYIADILYSH